jgi:hypothetical protein
VPEFKPATKPLKTNRGKGHRPIKRLDLPTRVHEEPLLATFLWALAKKRNPPTAEAFDLKTRPWTPAFAGMTSKAPLLSQRLNRIQQRRLARR